MWKIFFSDFIQIFCFYEHIEKWKWYDIDIQIHSISLWNLKYDYSFLFVMIIMSAAISKCYLYGSIILLISVFYFDYSIKICHARSYAGSIMHSTRTFVITVSKNRLSCRPHLEQKLRLLLLLLSLHVRTVAWVPLTIVTSCFEQLNLLTKASMIIARVE